MNSLAGFHNPAVLEPPQDDHGLWLPTPPLHQGPQRRLVRIGCHRQKSPFSPFAAKGRTIAPQARAGPLHDSTPLRCTVHRPRRLHTNTKHRYGTSDPSRHQRRRPGKGPATEPQRIAPWQSLFFRFGYCTNRKKLGDFQTLFKGSSFWHRIQYSVLSEVRGRSKHHSTPPHHTIPSLPECSMNLCVVVPRAVTAAVYRVHFKLGWVGQPFRN